MRKSEDFCKELKWTHDSDPGRYGLFKELIEPIVKQAQIDAIEETVKRCAEKAQISHDFYRKDEDYKEYCEFEGTYPERYDSYGESYGVDVFQINKQSILNVTEELKKELKNE